MGSSSHAPRVPQYSHAPCTARRPGGARAGARARAGAGAAAAAGAGAAAGASLASPALASAERSALARRGLGGSPFSARDLSRRCLRSPSALASPPSASLAASPATSPATTIPACLFITERARFEGPSAPCFASVCSDVSVRPSAVAAACAAVSFIRSVATSRFHLLCGCSCVVPSPRLLCSGGANHGARQDFSLFGCGLHEGR